MSCLQQWRRLISEISQPRIGAGPILAHCDVASGAARECPGGVGLRREVPGDVVPVSGRRERRLLGREHLRMSRHMLIPSEGKRGGEVVELLENEVPARCGGPRHLDDGIGRAVQEIEEKAGAESFESKPASV